ncbi:unnamed protein product [Peniophora sp. CBMAI 1063]|nr:unnamed protein product [Peniophora sp. CBMAI 1063]
MTTVPPSPPRNHIAALPPELIRMIFRHTMISIEEEGLSFFPDLTAIVISVSCRTFRQIALSFPDLWTQINILWKQPVIDLYLERAGMDSLVSVYHCAREAATVASSDSSDDGQSATSTSSRKSHNQRSRSLSVTSTSHDEDNPLTPEPDPPELQRLSTGLLTRARSLQLDERKQSQNPGLFMMYAQTALRQAQTLSALESFTLLCDDFTNIYFAESHEFEGLKTLRLADVVLHVPSRLFAPTITSLVLRSVSLHGESTSLLLIVLAGTPVLKHLEIASMSDSVRPASAEKSVYFPADVELHCKFSGANRMLANASKLERQEALPLRDRAVRLLSAMCARYQPALAIPGNRFTKITITSPGQFVGCCITLENPMHITPLSPSLPERVVLQLMDANSGPPSHVDVPKLIAHLLPLLPSPDSGYTTLIVGPVPWAREHAAWLSGFGAALQSISTAEVAGIAGEGLLAAMSSNRSAGGLLPGLSTLVITHLNPATIEKQAQIVRTMRPQLDIKLAAMSFLQ